MVKRSGLQLDDALMESTRSRPRARAGPKEPREHKPRISRADNALAVSLVLAVLTGIALGFTYSKENWYAVVLIGLMFLASELFALPMKSGGRLSLALLGAVMAMMISGPLGAAALAAFGIPIFLMEMEPHGYRRVAFNFFQYFFAIGAAALVFKYTGGAVLDPALKGAGKLVLPWILATIVFFVLNTLLSMPVLTSEHERMLRFWQRRLLPRLPGYLFYSGIGFLLAIAYVKLEFPAVVMIFAPVLAVRVIYTRYHTMRDVCDDTTLAIMEAVEHGSMFMEGHSVGVADVAVAIGEEMDFAEEDIHSLRQAALLHDIGKLALDPAIVDKPGPLSPEEYEEIKRHPLIGAAIVSKETLFQVVAPNIRHHHEMTDGSGYPDGLTGDTIPPGARILAVADAFDAMQRPIGFREPLTSHEAASEVVRAKGIQFDPDVVDAFIKVVVNRGLWEGALKDRVRMPVKERPQQQMTLEEQPSPAEGGDEGPPPVEETRPPGATPGEGMKYDDVRGDIEKDIREWKRSDSGQRRTRESRRSGSRRKKTETDEG